MKLLVSILLALLPLSASALPSTISHQDVENVRKYISGEHVDFSGDENVRVFIPIKTVAAQQPQNLLELGKIAKELSDSVAKNGGTDDDILKASAILLAFKANDRNFNTHPFSDEEKAAAKNIENLHSVFKK
jgi:hypothetical protein